MGHIINVTQFFERKKINNFNLVKRFFYPFKEILKYIIWSNIMKFGIFKTLLSFVRYFHSYLLSQCIRNKTLKLCPIQIFKFILQRFVFILSKSNLSLVSFISSFWWWLLCILQQQKKHSLSIVKLQCMFSSCFVSFACHTHATELLITNTPSSYLYWFTFVSLCPL